MDRSSLNRPSREFFQQLKEALHAEVLQAMDLESLRLLEEEVARERVNEKILELLDRDKQPLTGEERARLARAVLDELFGLGPLEPLLEDREVSDVLVNGAYEVYVERHGLLSRTEVRFNDDPHLLRIINRIVSRVGRRVDESSPMADARLQDGSRVNVIIPPLALNGPVVSIRRFGIDPLKAEDLVKNETLTPEMLELLSACVEGKLNILISGGTGAGKTTILNVLSAFVPGNERIITIEDAAELQLKQEHVVRLETRPPNIEGRGAVKQRQLVINALRMRPDRIIVGEVRGEEAVDMLQAMNTGHEGSMTTIHANGPRDSLSRIETMVSMANLNLPDKAVRHQIAAGIDLVIQASRMPDGSRKVTSISEIVGMEGSIITMQELFLFERQGYTEGRKVKGRYRATGIRPKFSERLLAAGIRLDVDMFASELLVN